MTDFAPEGYKQFPPIQQDLDRIKEFSDWDTEVIEQRIKQYGYFLQNNPMPRAEKNATRVTAHLMFELFWRRGGYDDYCEDELCNGSDE